MSKYTWNRVDNSSFLSHIRQYEEVTRDFCHGVSDLDQRRVMLYPWVKSKIDTPIAAPLKQISFFEKVSDLIDAKSPALDADMIPFISAPESNIKGILI